MDQQKLIIKALLELTKRLKDIQHKQDVIAENVEYFKDFLQDIRQEDINEE